MGHGTSNTDWRERVLPATTEPAAHSFIDFLGGSVHRHGLIGHSRLTPVRVLIAVAGFFLSLGWLQKANCARTSISSGGPYIDWSGRRQYTSACYNDTITLYGSRGLDTGAFPYLHSWQDGDLTRYMEYPVVTGVYQWFTAQVAFRVHDVWDFLHLPTVAPASVYYAVSCVFLAACWMTAVGLMAELTGNRVWDTVLMAASPLVIVHAFTNFDLLSILPAIAALTLWKNRRPGWAGVAIGIGIAAKLWPAFVGGALILLLLRQRQWRTLGTFVTTTGVTWSAIDLPIYLLSPDGWGEFFRLNSVRGWEGSTIYAVIAHLSGNDAWNGISPSKPVEGVEALNLLSTMLMVAALVAIAVLVMRAPQTPRVGQIVYLAVLAFMVTNKVWSPQYSIWLVPLLVLVLPRWRLVLGWAAFETVYFYVRMWQFLPAGEAAPDWLADTMTVIRLGWLLAIAVIVACQIMTPDQDPIRQAHSGRDPLAGVLAEEAGQARGGGVGGEEKRAGVGEPVH